MPPDPLISTLRAHISAEPSHLSTPQEANHETVLLNQNPHWEKAIALLQSCPCYQKTDLLSRHREPTLWLNTPEETAKLLSVFLWALNQEKHPEPPLSNVEAAQICRLLNTHEAPYYPRYLVSSRLFSTNLFWALKEHLAMPGMILCPGHSQQQRIDAISPLFPGGSTLVDIGCGKATYLRILGERYFSVIGFEKDEPTRKEAAYVLRRQGVAQAKLLPSFNTARQIPHGAHVLMTEVMEHMPKPVAQDILAHLGLSRAQCAVLTAPNRSFNKHYGLMPSAFRHWDHHWEPDETEFQETVLEAFGSQWECTFRGIGDTVNGAPSTLLCYAVQPAIKTLW